jgi:hypothetical protein
MSIFEVSPEDIEKLSDSDLRTLVAYLAEQEVVRSGHSPVSVTYGGHQNAADGGIDVRVDLASSDRIAGYVPRPKTAFQVKAEDMAKGGITSEMKPKGKLRPAIIALGKAGGAYIIVSSKGTLSDTRLTERKNAMHDVIAGVAGVEKLHLDFYDRRRLATWVNQNPGLIPWVRGRSGKPLAGWQPFGDWSSSPGKVEDEYLLDADVRLVGVRLKDTDGLSATDGINRVREALREPNGIVRLVGLSGVGKTRFVQALFDQRVGEAALSPTLAVYTDVADTPDPLPFDLVTRLRDLGQSCVLVIDNCGVALHRKLSARIRGGGSPISLITIEYDISDDEPEGTDVFRLEPASPEVVERILKIKHPHLAGPERRSIASFSEGNSRVALALADTARHGESLANLKDSDLFKRLFRQKNHDDPALLQAAKVCSLVYSFDGETLSGDGAELPILASLAGQTVDEFYRHVAELHRRQLVQKRGKWRAFLPHALAHRLSREALEDLTFDAIQQHFTTMAGERLVKSFSRRLGCLHDSPKAQQIVAAWLGPKGWLADTENLNELGLTVFDNVAPVNPDAVLSAIRHLLSKQEPTELKSVLIDKVGSLLRSLAYEPAQFEEATRLIGILAGKGDPSNRTNDAVNIFKSLFYMYLSGTHATVEQRAAVLESLGSSSSADDQTLALPGLEAMLETDHFSSMYSFEFGTRKRDYGLQPRLGADVEHWIRVALSLCETLASQPLLRERVRKQFGKDLRSLSHYAGLTDEIIGLAGRFNADGGWPQGWAAAKSAVRSLSQAKKPDVASRYQALADQLEPNDLSTRIASYVLPERWSTLDVAEVEFNDEKRYAKAEVQVEKVCRDIGSELAADTDAFSDHLTILLKSKSSRAWTVFSEIAKRSSDCLGTWRKIVSAYSDLAPDDRSSDALAGYVAGLAERDLKAREELLDEALATPAVHDCLVRLHISPRVSTAGAKRLAAAARVPSVPTWTFSNLQMGRTCDSLTGAQFANLISAICERDDGIGVAIEMMAMRAYSYRDDQKPLDGDDRETGRRLLLNFNLRATRDRSADEIARIAKSCLKAPGDEAVARQICERLLDGFNSYAIHSWDYGKLVGALAEEFPRTVLDVLVGSGQPSSESRRSIFQDFRETRPCPLDKISDAALVEWARLGSEDRFGQLADSIRAWSNADGSPNDEDPGSLVWTSAARNLIAAAPDPLPILNAFFHRFHPSGWSGSLTEILRSRLSLLDQLDQDANPVVADWAKRVRPEHEAAIEKTRAWEERESRTRDERFEW